MEAILERQTQIATSIERIISNFKKDSATRKTSEYLKTREETLTNLWGEFVSNDALLQLEEDKTHDYFTLNIFQNVKQLYTEGFQLILNTKPYKKPGDNMGAEGSTEETKVRSRNIETTGSASKSDELLCQQRTNFRAFDRAVKNINIDKLIEKWEIDDKLQMIQSRWRIIDDLHWQLDNLLEGSDETYENNFSHYEELYEKIKSKLHRKLNSVKHQQETTPHIELPFFSGNYTNWLTFSDLYCEAIHNNPNLNKCQKMQHLKGKLRGEAERLVQHLTISADNYDTCWEILNRRYNNVQLLFTKQMQIFMNQPAMQKHNAYEIKRLHDVSLETVHAVHNLGVDTSTWDPILVHIMTDKMDAETYTAYMDARKNKRDLPSFDELISILESKFTALEPLHKKTKQTKQPTITKENEPKQQRNYMNTKPTFVKSFKTQAERICPLCKTNDHVLITCKRFLNMTPEAKVNAIKTLPVCENCLFYHINKCTSTKKCKICNSPHHTILHDIYDRQPSLSSDPQPSTSTSPPMISKRKSNHVAGNYDEVLLSTVELNVRARDGTFIMMRCLLDQGSQINLITESAAQRLNLERCHQSASVFGVGISASQSHGAVQLVCESRYGNYTFITDALVMHKVVGTLPNYTFEKQSWPHLHNINLADPDYNISRPVDILLNAKVYSEILMDGILRGAAGEPIAQQTKLGWILVGHVKTFNCHAVLNNLEEISQFWELEEITQNNSNMTPSQDFCETLYQSTTTRRQDGRYVVKIPMKPNFEEHLTPSRSQAAAQFFQLEKKFARDPVLAENYKKFIAEYIKLGHMKQCTTKQEPSCFLPHHGVIRPDSLSTRLRTVFNASSKLKSGYTLNDLMECGPKLQKDLQAIILLWRTFQFVYTADIEKFYRQILVTEEDQHLQKIVWREAPLDTLKDYQLCTITYGTKSAPYLAMRTIQQLIQDDGTKYPLAVDILNKQLYVDDLLGGANTIETAKEAQEQIITLLNGGGFPLKKWASNDPRLLEHLPKENISQNMFDFKHAETNKTLGLSWNPCNDKFSFSSSVTSSDKVENPQTTKRLLLSEISKLFDPLGWLSPITIKGKLLFQKVWAMNLNWDDCLPSELQHDWNILKQDLPKIAEVKIARWIGDYEKPIELHGFCDASEKAYGCVIYCKSVNENNEPVIKLVAGKTKLAPLSKSVSLPRLELCASLLLAQLMKKVIESTTKQTGPLKIYGWTDSMVVLGWLQGDIGRWKSFVANRVASILETMPPSCWKYVRSEENPADCASRGLLPSQLLTHQLWWEGPNWLKKDETQSPTQTEIPSPHEERKSKVCITQNVQQNSEPSIIEECLEKHSSMERVTRTIAWLSRFIYNSRNADKRKSTYLQVNELTEALKLIVKVVQYKHYKQDIDNLSTKKKLSSKSPLLNLNPWLDEDGILRVGGRLENSILKPQEKHPMIIPNNNKLTTLLIQWAHNVTLHGGARLTLTFLRTRFWMVGGMSAVKHEILKCVRCIRYKISNRRNQIMADLPKPRVTPSRPFTHTGVDLAGPVDVKSNKGRGIATSKGYVVIFICLSTKAVHLELVSDLSSVTFIAALKRLCGRRGMPKHIYSDCGTNFVGASNSLNREHQLALKQYLSASDVMDHLTKCNIEWHFNAPSWPTAGGLWEAAVKQMKYHLKRILGEQKITYEEFMTLLTQIEACLNSRPLVALTNSIEDLDCLTPGHFLVGDQLLAPPLSQEVENISLGTRWKLMEKMHKDFWRRWSTEYLQTLQGRSKWHFAKKDLCVGDLVIIQEDNVPPARWLLGRIVETHPGNDGRVRVVTLRTKNNNRVKRPIGKLIRLPVESETLTPPENNSETQNSELLSPPPQPQPEQKPATENTNISNEENRKQTRRRQRKRVNISNIFMLLLTFCTASYGQTTHQLGKVSTIQQNQPLYFDKLADMLLVQDEWKMVVYYNLTTYWHSLGNVEYHVNLLRDLSKEEPSFSFIATQLHHEVQELLHNNLLLKTEHGRRYKRGLINGIGYVANELFGILDERAAQKYDSDIKAIQENENHLNDLYKKQVSILEGEQNVLKRNEELMIKQFTSISRQMSHLNNLVQSDHNRTTYIMGAVLSANLIIDNLRRLQQQLLDLVTDVRSGRIDTHLLQPEEFENQLNIITAQIAPDVTLPCVSSQQDCIREMYKLSRVHVRLTEYLIFEVKLPLISNDHFELNRIIPIPRLTNDIVTTIVPTAKYCALSLRKDMIIPITEETMHTSCISFKENKMICRLNLPIHTITKELSILCEAQVINNNNLSNCGTTVSTCRNDWIMLHSRAEWLFTCCLECTVRIFCPGAAVSTETLRGTGVMKLKPGCMLKGENIVIHSPKLYRSEIFINKNIEDYIPESGVNNILTNFNFTYVPEPHEHQFRSLQNQIDSVKASQENLHIHTSSHDVHNYVVYTLIGMGVTILITIYVSRKIRQYKANRNCLQEIELQSVRCSTPSEGTDSHKRRDSERRSTRRVNRQTSP